VLPFIALAHGLQARGHAVRIASSVNHAGLVTGAGIDHVHMRPDLSHRVRAERDRGQVPDIRRLLAEVIAPGIAEGYADLVAACGGGTCDLLLGSVAPIAPMAAETLGITWAPAVLQPIAYLSASDPPVLPGFDWLVPLRRFGRLHGVPLRAAARLALRHAARPFAAARRSMGLGPARDPLLNWAVPPPFGLALFSPELAAGQADWPGGARPTGFCRWPDGTNTPEVAAFLDAGRPPLVVSLGSSMVRAGGLPAAIHAAAIAAAGRVGLRCLLLVGTEGNLAALPVPLPSGCLAVLGAPHGVVFPRAAAILHHGGAGTTGEAMRAGRPMLVTPFAGDQFDNAARMVRSGVAASRAAASADATSLEAMLRRVLAPEVIARASALGARVSAEDGVGAACDVIEHGLRRTGRA
jgi:UDP:flavonoid glycosyltransferase YjiC (YdhE family)